MNKSKHNRPPGYLQERAKFWSVSLRVAQLWARKGVPLDDTQKMIAWYAALPPKSQGKLTPAFRRRVTELRVAADKKPGGALSGDEEFTAFENDYDPGAQHDKTVLADLKKQFAFYLFKQRQCTSRNDQAGASEALRQLTQLGALVHDMELRAQKLGRDLGDLVPRRVLEQCARSLAYHLLRCGDALLHELTLALTRRDPTGAPLSREEIRFIAEPLVLTASIIRPIERASHGDNPAAPPAWLVAALQAGIADVLEHPPATTPSPSLASPPPANPTAAPALQP